MADKKAKKAVVAMSGGVDSSVALAMLKDEGYDCVGVSMQLWDYSKKEDASGAGAGTCCSLDDIYDARAVADKLGVPFYAVNMEEVFSKEVVSYFIKSYAAGQTPNPCVKCNQLLKFDVLLKKALGLEADFLATGHYARIIRDEAAGHKLLKGTDDSKDQSYFLFTMTRGQLGSVLFPVGGITKKDVRLYAKRLGLKTSEKKESQEICFVQEPSYAQFLSAHLPRRCGEIADADGRVIGSHKGLFNYTVGQRKGLNLSGGPYYVIGLDTEANRLIVGREEELFSSGLFAREVNWISGSALARIETGEPLAATVKIRYRHEGADALIRKRDCTPGNGCIPGTGVGLEVSFKTPQKAVTPGQAAVFYSGDEVLGGGWIERAIK